ncbi:predicted protein [Plenodomus lingam JN3]|uniref:Predicted protein n=1 Tax=Leptosphaeria maculans (strain JN3 / isolate v23.1.3 / race Av1-4-5-6-7-8) TaxID=985895 RepID=E4ZQG3_LEPMJ|nr:predicted protein [Plenodomus lingam JN3]CBX93638.1 predicted protein [Plenodomus lingam JN3]
MSASNKQEEPEETGKGWSMPYMQDLLHKMWRVDSEFSEARLQQIRGQKTDGKFAEMPFDFDFMVEHIGSEGPEPFEKRGPVIDNEIHPMFTKFMTSLPMEEVREQMEPSLRLATNMITNPRALEWFSHVRHAHKGRSRSGRLMTLNHDPYSTTAEALDIVRRDLLKLADAMTLQWVGKLIPFEDIEGKYHDQLTVIETVLKDIKAPESEDGYQTVLKPKARKNFLKAVTDGCYPTIWFNMKFFHEFLLQSNQADYPARLKRLSDFRFSSILLHEVAHAWTTFCHRKSPGNFVEPLILRSDLYSEAGQSWEQFMYGAQIYPRNSHIHGREIADSLMAKSRNDETIDFCASIPQAWVDQWFLKSTWDQFSELHREGKQFSDSNPRDTLTAPAPAYQTEHWRFKRYCGKQNRAMDFLSFSQR